MYGTLRNLVRGLAILVFAGAATAASASVVTDASVEALARESAAVVRGRVIARRTVRADAGRRVFTLVTVRVDDALGGEAPETLQVVLPGGVDGDLMQRVAGVPLLSVRDEVILFLDRWPGGPRPEGLERFRLRGMGLGAFRVTDGVARRLVEGLEVVTGPLDAPRPPDLQRALPVTDLASRVRRARLERPVPEQPERAVPEQPERPGTEVQP